MRSFKSMSHCARPLIRGTGHSLVSYEIENRERSEKREANSGDRARNAELLDSDIANGDGYNTAFEILTTALTESDGI